MAQRAKSIKRNALSDIGLSEISLVDRPANPGARLHLFKRDEADVPEAIEAVIKDAQSFNDIWNATDIEEEWWKLSSALRNSISSILSDSAVTDKKAKISASIDQFKTAVIGEVDEASTVTKKESDMDQVAKADHDKVVSENEALKAQLAKAQTDAAVAALPVDHKAHYDGLGDVAKADFLKADAAKRADIVKAATALPDHVAKAMEDIRKENAALKARVDASDAEKRDAAALAKARDILGANGGDAAELATVIKGLDESGIAALEKQFKAVSSVAKFSGGKDPYRAVGKTATGADNGVAATFEGKVSDLRKSDPKLTVEQAQLRVMESNPELYEQMEAH